MVTRFNRQRDLAAICLLSIGGAAIAAPTVLPEFEIHDADAATGNRFGTTLAHGSGFLAVGSPQWDLDAESGGTVLSAGRVTIERPIWIGDGDIQSEGAVTEIVSQSDSTQNMYFGDSLASDQSTLFVGAPGWRLDGSASTTRGTVYVYDVPPGLLAKAAVVQQLNPPSLDNHDQFGQALATGVDYGGNSWLAVGAPGRDSNRGSVWLFLFDDDAGEWAFHEVIMPATLQNGDDFGAAVSIYNNLLVIGAPGTESDSGAVHVYRVDSSEQSWTASHIVTAADTNGSGQLGAAVAASEDFVLMGAPDGAGNVSLWRDISTAGLLSYESDLEPDSWANIEYWGQSLSIEDDRIAVGSRGIAATFRQINTDSFAVTAMLEEGDWGFDARHGECVLIDDAMMWVGAPRANSDGESTGAVARWEISRTPGCPSDLGFDFAVDSDDLVTLLDDWGSAQSDLTGDDLTGVEDLLTLLSDWGTCDTL